MKTIARIVAHQRAFSLLASTLDGGPDGKLGQDIEQLLANAGRYGRLLWNRIFTNHRSSIRRMRWRRTALTLSSKPTARSSCCWRMKQGLRSACLGDDFHLHWMHKERDEGGRIEAGRVALLCQGHALKSGRVAVGGSTSCTGMTLPPCI